MIDLSSFSFGLLPVEILAVVILLALAVMWVVRKIQFFLSVDWEHDPDYGGDGQGYD